jgi:hypothetical protein
MICSGANGTLFEVTPSKEIVWKYINPSKGGMTAGPVAPPGQILSPIAAELLGVSAEQRRQIDTLQKDIAARLDKLLTVEQKKQFGQRGSGGFFPPLRPGQVMAAPDQARLKLTEEQKKDLASLQKAVDERFDGVLTLAQRKQIKSAFAPFVRPSGVPGPGGRGNPAHPGKLFSAAQQDTLKLSAEQKKRLEEMQKEIDTRLVTLLTEEQKRQLQAMQRAPAVTPGVPVRGAPPPRGGPPPGGSPVFRAYRYPSTYSAFAGRKWAPGKTLEELQKGPDKKEAPTKK